MRLVVGLALLATAGSAAEPATATGRQLKFTVTPTAAGRQLVRLSLPFPAGMLSAGQGLAVSDGYHETVAAVRVLTWHPCAAQDVRSVRRGLVTFPHTFANGDPVSFLAEPSSAGASRVEPLPVEVKFDGSAVSIAYRDGPSLTARLLAPARVSDVSPTVETVDRTGGTRYNNLRAMNRTPPDDDRHFMWRSNNSVDFCTKGYSSFLLAYEQTGDPRMREALDAQVNYASRHVHTDRGEARNIGDVDDFLRLYRCTGERRYVDEAVRLFRELRPKLSTGFLFSQSGQPIEPPPPFINDDDNGYVHPFAKPYILGYALLGLPRLAQLEEQEPQLRAVIRAVADFMAASQDQAGGWRYPHPRSSYLILDQAIEHAWQIVVADTLLGPQGEHLDAIERVLRQRYHGWKQTGMIPGGVTGWELVAGKVQNPAAVQRLYKHPADRDPKRDYKDGSLAFGSSSPEGLVYFSTVLAFYLNHRPASRLLLPPREDDPLGELLAGARRRRK